MIVLDASILIAYLERNDVHHDAAEALLAEEVDDLGINVLTLAEVLVAPTQNGRVGEVLSMLADLEVAELPMPSQATTHLARLRTTTRLRMPDCCVLLAAQEANARVASFDLRLTAAASALGLVTVGESGAS